MSFTSPYKQHNYLGEITNVGDDDSDALTMIRNFKWDSNKDGTGNPENGMWYYDKDNDRYRAYINGSWTNMDTSGFTGQQIYYVGKHGDNSNDGKSPAKAFLTIGTAIAAISGQSPSSTNRFVIFIEDSGIYDEDITFDGNVPYTTLFAPNATLKGYIYIAGEGTIEINIVLDRLVGEGGSTRAALDVGTGVDSTNVKINYIENTYYCVRYTDVDGIHYLDVDGIHHNSGTASNAIYCSGTTFFINVNTIIDGGSDDAVEFSGAGTRYYLTIKRLEFSASGGSGTYAIVSGIGTELGSIRVDELMTNRQAIHFDSGDYHYVDIGKIIMSTANQYCLVFSLGGTGDRVVGRIGQIYYATRGLSIASSGCFLDLKIDYMEGLSLLGEIGSTQAFYLDNTAFKGTLDIGTLRYRNFGIYFRSSDGSHEISCNIKKLEAIVASSYGLYAYSGVITANIGEFNYNDYAVYASGSDYARVNLSANRLVQSGDTGGIHLVNGSCYLDINSWDLNNYSPWNVGSGTSLFGRVGKVENYHTDSPPTNTGTVEVDVTRDDLTISSAGHQDSLDVFGVKTIIANTASNDVRFGGFTQGLNGQKINIIKTSVGMQFK